MVGVHPVAGLPDIYSETGVDITEASVIPTYLYIFRLVVSPAPKAANQKEKHILPAVEEPEMVGEIILTRLDLQGSRSGVRESTSTYLLPVLKMSK